MDTLALHFKSHPCFQRTGSCERGGAKTIAFASRGASRVGCFFVRAAPGLEVVFSRAPLGAGTKAVLSWSLPRDAWPGAGPGRHRRQPRGPPDGGDGRGCRGKRRRFPGSHRRSRQCESDLSLRRRAARSAVSSGALRRSRWGIIGMVDRPSTAPCGNRRPHSIGAHKSWNDKGLGSELSSACLAGWRPIRSMTSFRASCGAPVPRFHPAVPSTPSSPPTVTVLGGGIVGLATALGLLQSDGTFGSGW